MSTRKVCGEDSQQSVVGDEEGADIVVHVRERILKPVEHVFSAFVDPKQMANYFISGASGPMIAGKTVIWEFDDVGATVSIDVLEVEANRRIVYQSQGLGASVVTTIAFAPDGPDACVVTITDSKFPFTEHGVQLALGQNAGWTYTLCCLKAYMQFGINLRKGLNRRITDTQ